MILAWRRPQSTPNDLHEQNFRFRRPCENDASHIPVNAHGQHADIAHDLDLTTSEFTADFIALSSGRIAIDIASTNSSGYKLVLDVLGMKSVDGKAKGGSTNGVLEPSLHDMGHERMPVHGVPKFIDLIVASDHAHPLQIWVCRRKDFELREVSCIDQVLCRGRNDEFMVVAAQPSRPRGCT